MAKELTMHVITGTHWDREWRHTAEQSKLRLMDLIDSIVDILDKDPEYNSFILDGGTIVLEDYFTVRPEMKDKIKALIEAKKLFIVNWYTLPETYTVAPEALIRNLQVGTKMAKEFGGAMRAGYTATGYGQTSQLPQIYEGFGIKTAMFYRGTNKYELPPLFKWEAKDGTQIFVHKTFDEVTRTNWYFYVYDLIALGKGTKDLSFTYKKENVPVHLCDSVLYEKAVKQTVDKPTFDNTEEGLKKALNNIKEQVLQYKIGNHLLALNMEDNAEPHPLHKRLELVRKAFEKDDTVNVVYTSFDVIDENNNIVPHDRINMSVREIIDGHKVDIVEGENAWINITTKKKYTNLTSCTAVRTSLACMEPFPIGSASEDSHTWVRYGAHPGKFVFLRDIKGKYRICSNVDSRSRSNNADFYGQMLKMDSAGFEEAMKLAKKYGTMGGWDENDLRTAFHVRLALSLLHGSSEEYCRKSLSSATSISKEKTLKYIDLLYCEPEYRARMKELVSE